MEEKDTKIPDQPKNPGAEKPRKPLWRRILKWSAIILGSLVGLFLLAATLIVWILTPAKLTPLVNRTASKYLNADVSSSRVELTFWSTFPNLTLEIDSLEVVSHSLRSLPADIRASLPADADSLLAVGSLHAGINLAPLAIGHVALYDVIIKEPRVNILAVNDSVSNLDIFQTSGESADTTSTPMPSVSINHFLLENAGPLRYRSLQDSTDIAVSLKNVSLHGDNAPEYRLAVAGGASLPVLRDFNLHNLTFGLDGAFSWNPDTPFAIGFKDVDVSLNDYAAQFSGEFDCTKAPTLNSLSINTKDLPVCSLLTHLPPSVRELTDPVSSDMKLTASLELTRPYVLTDTTSLPSFRASLEVPRCKVSYDNRPPMEFETELDVDFNGADINASIFDLKKLKIKGRTIDFTLSGKATDVMADPKVEGRFRGTVNLSAIPPRLARRLPLQLAGLIRGETDFRLRLNDLTPKRFHKIYVDGSLDVSGFKALAPEKFEAHMNHGRLEFGTTDSFVRDTHRVDSLLKVSLQVDTLSLLADSMRLELKELRAGIGSVNRASSSDTTEINPIGGSIAVERLKFDSPADTMRIRLRDARIGGAIRRFQGNARAPQMNLRIYAGRVLLGQAYTRFSLRNPAIALNVNLRPRPASTLTDEQRARRRQLRHLTDSVAEIMARERGDLDLRLDKGMRRMLRRWDFNGSITADGGRFITPSFPLDNRILKFDVRFNPDSLIFTDTRVKSGQSDFALNGAVTNIRRALTATTQNSLAIDLNLSSDTINVNQIVKALFSGTAAVDNASLADDDADDLTAPVAVAPADTAAIGPLLIPHNIDARLRLSADKILYSDLLLDRFRGELLLYDGAVNLRDLSASTNIGSLALNGLYSSANADSLQFGLGMKVDRFRLDQLTTLVPAIDSLMPVMKDFAGIVNADIAVTTDILHNMDIDIPSLRAAIKIEGDSLVLLDPDTFKTLSKWLMFKNKKKNMIDHISAEVIIENSAIELYPFMFTIDRYRLGVMGNNDMAMHLNYHISVLKSPIPFKFGINIKGTPDNMKIRVGGAKFKENMVVERQTIADNTRVNLVREIENVFRRGVSKARMGRLHLTPAAGTPDAPDTPLNYSDSLSMIRAGLIENPDTLRFPLQDPDTTSAPLQKP